MTPVANSRWLRLTLVALAVSAAVPARATPGTADHTAAAVEFEAQLGLARTLRDAGRVPEALDAFRRARLLRPEDRALRLEAFWVEIEADPRLGLAAGAPILQDDPRADDVRDRLIGAAAALGDEARVQSLATGGTRVAPANPRWWRRLGESALRRTASAEAAGAFARVVAHPGAGAEDWAFYALALESAGRPTEAAAAWARLSPEVTGSNRDWAAGRWRVLIAVAPVGEAIRGLETACAEPVPCEPLRAALVSRLQRSGEPARALAVLQPLLVGDQRTRWLRVASDLARAAGDVAAAARYRSELIAAGAASSDDVALTLGWHALEGSASGVLAVARVARLSACDERVLDALASVADAPSYIERIIAMPATCPGWAARRYDATGRLMAARDLDRALSVIEPVAIAPGAQRPTVERYGQLLAWTGRAARAVGVLERLDPRATGSLEGADALIDAYHAVGRSRDAWALARWRVGTGPVPDGTRVRWAEIGVESGDPAGALDLLSALPEDAPAAQRPRLLARAALGSFHEVLGPCEQLPERDVSAWVALSCADALEAMRGRTAARRFLERFATPPTAPDVSARLALWASLDGDTAVARRLREGVVAVSPDRGRVLDAEVALRQGRPADALTALEWPASPAFETRAMDLRSLALSAGGRHGEAVDELARLRERADAPRLEVRQREWEYRWSGAPDALDALLDLARTSPAHVPVRETAAAVLFDRRDYPAARAMLEPVAGVLTIDGRVTFARTLRAVGDSRAAVAVLRHTPLSRVEDRILFAELIGAVEGPAAADAAFGAMTAAGPPPVEMFLAWSHVVSGTRRIEVLRAATRLHPGASPLWTALADSLAATGRDREALDTARRALALDARDLDAWMTAIAAAAHAEAAGVDPLLDGFEREFAGSRTALVTMATRIGARVHDAGDPLGRRAVAWLDQAVGTPPDPAAQLARARVNARRTCWDAALADLAGLAASVPRSPEAARLRAEVLSYAGRHQQAVAAYDAYLALVPNDLAAARQQARVAAWAQDFEDADRRYAALVSAHPADRALRLEARAKRAFSAGHWEEAAAAYDEWLGIEPGDSEAAFERAQALSQAGDARAAREAWNVLMTRAPGHRQAAAARRRFELAGRPAARPVFAWQSANGYGGQRLLNIGESGASASVPFGPARAVTLLGGLGGVRASAADASWSGSTSHAGAAIEVRQGLLLVGRAGAFTLDGTTTTTVDASASWDASDEVTLRTSVLRAPWLENAATVDAGLASTSWSAGLSGRWLDTGMEASASRRWLTDGNSSWSVEGSARRRLVRGRDEIAAVTWTSWQRFGRSVPAYFSPTGFFRLDAGVEWRHWFDLPRFADDLARYLTASYQVGLDDRGALYHHPTLRGGWEINDLLLVEAGGDWIVSSVYDQVRATVQLRVGGPGRRY